MTLEEFKKSPIVPFLKGRGLEIKGEGDRPNARCPFHEDGTASLSIDAVKNVWYCHACKIGGTAIDFVMRKGGLTFVAAMKELGISVNGASHAPPHAAAPEATGPSPELKFETVCTYDYVDCARELVYQVVRQHAPSKAKASGYFKTFRQRHPGPNGSWVYNMDGIERCLYHLPEVLKSKTVWIVEGEKDADTLLKNGFTGTCNVGGAGKWMDGYTDSLAKKHVAICGDNDKPGQEHVKAVFESISGKVKSVRIVKVPEGFKDVTDYQASFKDDATFKNAMFSLYDDAVPFIKGIGLPIYRLSELEDIYKRHVARMDTHSFALSKWLPGLSVLRNLVPGELVTILAATGIGKTAALSNIAFCAFPIPTLFFELELPPELMFERILALKAKIACSEIERCYREGATLGEEAIDTKLSHLHICSQARLTVQDIETIVNRSELKIGDRPKIVLVDYMGLIHGGGKSKYEKASQIAEDLKVMAKTTQTVVILASQVNRDATSKTPEITLNSGKDSGSIENSSGLVIGMWRDEKNADTMHLKILKSTKGGAGTKLECNYNLKTLAITERSKIDDDYAAGNYRKPYSQSSD